MPGGGQRLAGWKERVHRTLGGAGVHELHTQRVQTRVHQHTGRVHRGHLNGRIAGRTGRPWR